ncbi:unnamed protein product, partial [Amoebophrya sp. A120]
KKSKLSFAFSIFSLCFTFTFATHCASLYFLSPLKSKQNLRHSTSCCCSCRNFSARKMLHVEFLPSSSAKLSPTTREEATNLFEFDLILDLVTAPPPTFKEVTKTVNRAFS